MDFRLRENIFLLKTCLKIRSDDKDVIMVMAMDTLGTFFFFGFVMEESINIENVEIIPDQCNLKRLLELIYGVLRKRLIYKALNYILRQHYMPMYVPYMPLLSVYY